MKKIKLLVVLGVLSLILSVGSNAFCQKNQMENGYHVAGID